MAWVFSLILHNMERRIRKLIRVSAITVGALLLTGFVVVAFVINYVFTPDKFFFEKAGYWTYQVRGKIGFKGF